ncbi:MAG: sugar ABC transporter ATP-binding protein [Rhizobiales bacterium]|nr:sugar ABC transporter ATP-binding protein [Hyphomicrobiales bacterium]
MSTGPILALRGLAKRYGAVEALRGVDLDVARGEVLAICGDNGAGKSSLLKVASGAEPPSAGEISLDGRAVSFRSPHDALGMGLATIYQDLALAPRLSIAQNVYMGSELTRGVGPLRLLDKAAMARGARALLARLNSTLDDMAAPVEHLSGGQRQAVAIARALRWDARLVLMDEPTAALGVRESAQVRELILRLKQEGRTVVLVSHDMRDVVAVADRVVILAGGRKAQERPVDGLDATDLTRLVMNAAA